VAFAPNPVGAHPIVKRLDGVMMRFPSSIDTVGTKTPIKKTVLLASSQLSRRQSMVRISLDDANAPLVLERFDKQHLPLAVLLEGRFSSPFEGRVPPAMDSVLRKLNTPFRAVSEPTKQIVVSDGDVGANFFDRRVRNLLKMGENPYTDLNDPQGSKGYVYGNRDFLMNCIDYLTDKRGIVAARNKDYKLRLLDKKAINDPATGAMWQGINIGLPLLFLALFGLLWTFVRKRRYGRH
jgi:gliding-associated putative ABC transporter substrate-binding component GldG